MKHYFFTLLIFSSIHAYSQSNETIMPFVKSVERNFHLKGSYKEDTCFYSYALLKMDTDSNYKVYSISLSDNAEDWLVEEFDKVKGKFILKPIEDYAQKNKIKSMSFFFPLIIRKDAVNCRLGSRYPVLSKQLFRFNNEWIHGYCAFENPIEIIYQ